jgi:hypothetical protein
LPAGVTVSTLNGALTAINENFDGGTSCNNFLVDPCCDLATLPHEGHDGPGSHDGHDGRPSHNGCWVTNRPNPFNPTTQISFNIEEAGFASLKIYNLLGQEVATLANGPQAAGVHTVGFNGASLPSGVYIYRLEAGGHVRQAKMLLLK